MILLIENSRSPTGAFQAAREIVNAVGAGNIMVVLPEGSKCEVGIDGVETLTLPMLEISRQVSLWRYLRTLMRNSCELVKLVRDNGVSVVHVNDMYNMLGVMLKLRGINARVVYHVRLMPDSYIAPLYPVFRFFAGRTADAIICVSDAVLASWRHLPQARRIYDRVSLVERLPMPEPRDAGEIRFVYIANYIAGKGQDLAPVPGRSRRLPSPPHRGSVPGSLFRRS